MELKISVQSTFQHSKETTNLRCVKQQSSSSYSFCLPSNFRKVIAKIGVSFRGNWGNCIDSASFIGFDQTIVFSESFVIGDNEEICRMKSSSISRNSMKRLFLIFNMMDNMNLLVMTLNLPFHEMLSISPHFADEHEFYL